MSDKKRMEEIEERVLVEKVYYKYLDGTNGHWCKVYTLSEEDYNYLKEQAERVQELESELNKQIEIGYKFEGEVYDLEKENKRYREALNSIITLWIASTDATDDTWLAHEMSETARQALEGENNE